MCPLHALLISALETRACVPLTWKYISLIQFISTQFTILKKIEIFVIYYWVALITIIHYHNWLNYLPNEQQTHTTDIYSTSETTSVEPHSPIVVWRFLSVPQRYYSVTWTPDPTWRPLDTLRPCMKIWVYVWRPAPVYCPVHLRVMEGRDSWLYFRGPYHYPPPL